MFIVLISFVLFLTVNVPIVSGLMFIIFALSYISVAFLFLWYMLRTYKWKKNGKELTQKLGLKVVLIIPSMINGKLVYELHHKPKKLSIGFSLMRIPKKDIKLSLINDAMDDFCVLFEWFQDKEERFITTTHPAMINLWKKAGCQYFHVHPTGKNEDPYTQMSKLQWAIAHFSTAGRISFHPPKQWETYEFERKENYAEKTN